MIRQPALNLHDCTGPKFAWSFRQPALNLHDTIIPALNLHDKIRKEDERDESIIDNKEASYDYFFFIWSLIASVLS